MPSWHVMWTLDFILFFDFIFLTKFDFTVNQTLVVLYCPFLEAHNSTSVASTKFCKDLKEQKDVLLME